MQSDRRLWAVRMPSSKTSARVCTRAQRAAAAVPSARSTPYSRILETCADLMQAKGIDRHYVTAVREAAQEFLAKEENAVAGRKTKVKNVKESIDKKTGKVTLKPTAPKGQSVSAKIAERKSEKKKIVSRAKATARSAR